MIKTSKILRVEITPEMRDIAKQKAEEMGKLRNSILKGEGNLTAFLGEEAVKQYLMEKGTVSGKNTYEYDFLFNDLKCEVKSKLTTVKPSSNYDCSVANFNHTQKCDIYIFVRVLDTLDVAWILGYVYKEDFFKRSIFLMMGDYDPSNDYVVKADCYNIKIRDLDNIKTL